MGHFLLLLVVALVVAGVVFGVTVLVTGTDAGLSPVEPDGRAVPLPGTRPLVESDVIKLRFDVVLRGYRMSQVDEALRRASYDIGYKDELISVLEAEVTALREGRVSDAEVLRRAREAALGPSSGESAAFTPPQENGRTGSPRDVTVDADRDAGPGPEPDGRRELDALVPAGQAVAGRERAGRTPPGRDPDGPELAVGRGPELGRGPVGGPAGSTTDSPAEDAKADDAKADDAPAGAAPDDAGEAERA